MAVLLRVFVGQHRLGAVWGAPDMVLEVMSPHPRIGDLALELPGRQIVDAAEVPDFDRTVT